MGKLRVAVVFGGRSGEHEVSLMSAQSVMNAIDRERYDVIPIGITKDGRWLVGGDPMKALLEGTAEAAGAALSITSGTGATIVPAESAGGAVDLAASEGTPTTATGGPAPLSLVAAADVFFPVLHGPYGEDGTIQGLFEMAGVPYVGAGVAASAVGMDKAFMKMAFQHAGLPVVDYIVITEPQWAAEETALRSRIERELGYPCFVKPANLGSSVGISRVGSPEELDDAVAEAFRHDRKIIVERAALDCREVEVSVLGNDDPETSIPGEIVPGKEFYDYEAKYLDDSSELIIPARISEEAAEKVRRMAVAAFQAVDAAGLARIDFFVHKETEEIWVNEINTRPGFTRISMYPKLWEATGLPYPELIHRLIQLGLERHQRRMRREEAAAGHRFSGR